MSRITSEAVAPLVNEGAGDDDADADTYDLLRVIVKLMIIYVPIAIIPIMIKNCTSWCTPNSSRDLEIILWVLPLLNDAEPLKDECSS